MAVAVAALATAVVATLVMVARLVTSSDRVDVTELEVGDCFDLPVDDEGDDGDEAGGTFVEIEPVEVVECGAPHSAQVVAIGELNPAGGRSLPTDDELFVEVDRRCAAVTADDRFGIVPIIPTEATWDGRDGRYSCVALAYGLTPLTGDHAAIRG